MEIDAAATLNAGCFRPQESLSIGTQLHRILRAAIIRGELSPGQAISEVEMSRKFNISRQPVREAFIKLGEERLIEVLPQRGTYIRKISVKEVLDARHLREIIEVSIVREVTGQKTPALIEALRELVAEQRMTRPGDHQAYLLLDEEFHRMLALHAGREYMWRVAEGIKAQTNRVRFLTLDFATPAPQLTEEHAGIVDAIEAGDSNCAARRMRRHLRMLLKSLPLMAEHYPEHFIAE